MNMEFKRKLPTPQTIRDMYPVSPELARQKQANDRAVRDVLTGEDDRLMLLIGPCSADREDAVLDYVTRLRGLQEKVKDKILLVPRVYSNKPRTTGDGYKGMLHQPDPNGDPDILKGLIATRKMHIKVLEQTGFSPAVREGLWTALRRKRAWRRDGAAQLAMEGGRSMKLLRVLLVDDEIMIREGFKRLFDWQAHGCEVVGEAADGVQALSQME